LGDHGGAGINWSVYSYRQIHRGSRQGVRRNVKVTVYGAGAIGGHLGAMMSRNGYDVSLVARGASGNDACERSQADYAG
jgi:hypothetical protein